MDIPVVSQCACCNWAEVLVIGFCNFDILYTNIASQLINCTGLSYSSARYDCSGVFRKREVELWHSCDEIAYTVVIEPTIKMGCVTLSVLSSPHAFLSLTYPAFFSSLHNIVFFLSNNTWSFLSLTLPSFPSILPWSLTSPSSSPPPLSSSSLPFAPLSLFHTQYMHDLLFPF